MDKPTSDVPHCSPFMIHSQEISCLHMINIMKSLPMQQAIKIVFRGDKNKLETPKSETERIKA